MVGVLFGYNVDSIASNIFYTQIKFNEKFDPNQSLEFRNYVVICELASIQFRAAIASGGGGTVMVIGTPTSGNCLISGPR